MERKFRLSLTILLVFLSLIAFVGCGGDTQTTGAEQEEIGRAHV